MDVRLLFVSTRISAYTPLFNISKPLVSQSGIFSAILTPFIVESYHMLEGQGPLPYFGTNGYKVRVNAMWFGSLLFSLIAALLSIHCKQWLDGYLVRTSINTQN